MENLSDTNVVKVNGSRISAPTKIFKGDIVEVGGVLISFGEQASSSSAILARRKIKTAISGVDNNAGVEYAQEVTPETEKEPGTLSPELDGYDTCSTTDQAASSSPDCVEEQQIMAIIGTASSPLGSKLLARKIRAQQQLKRQEEEGGEEEKEEKEEGGATEAAEGNTVGAASPVAVQDEEAVRTAGIIAHFGAATRLSNSPADSSYRIRMQYNRFAFSPSMGVTEEEHRDLLDAYVSQASSPIVQQRHFPSSTGLEETTFTSPAAARALLGQRAAYVVPSDAPASLDKTARRSYNQSVYSPSMFMTEAEVMSLRQLAAETRATETGIDEIRGIAEEEQETEFPLDFAA